MSKPNPQIEPDVWAPLRLSTIVWNPVESSPNSPSSIFREKYSLDKLTDDAVQNFPDVSTNLTSTNNCCPAYKLLGYEAFQYRSPNRSIIFTWKPPSHSNAVERTFPLHVLVTLVEPSYLTINTDVHEDDCVGTLCNWVIVFPPTFSVSHCISFALEEFRMEYAASISDNTMFGINGQQFYRTFEEFANFAKLVKWRLNISSFFDLDVLPLSPRNLKDDLCECAWHACAYCSKSGDNAAKIPLSTMIKRYPSMFYGMHNPTTNVLIIPKTINKHILQTAKDRSKHFSTVWSKYKSIASQTRVTLVGSINFECQLFTQY